MSNLIDATTSPKIIYHPKNIIKTPEDHIEGTGPEKCTNCLEHGSEYLPDGTYRWLGYCLNCALYNYRFHAGHGYEYGVEYTHEEWKRLKIAVPTHLLIPEHSWTKRCKYEDCAVSLYCTTETPQVPYVSTKPLHDCEYYTHNEDK